MPLPDLLAAAAIIAAGAMLQTAVGFGIGIVCVPLLLWAGWSLPSAVVTVLGAGLVQAAIGLFKTRGQLIFRTSVKVAVAQWLMVPVGVLSMSAVVALGPAVVKQGVGAMIAIILTLRLLVRPRPRRAVRDAWAYVCGGAGGLLAGMVGMGGPPIVLFALAHDWEKQMFRGFLWLQFTLATPLVLAVLVHRMGASLLVDFMTAVAFAPVVWLGSWAGLKLTERWATRQLSFAATLLLYAIAGASLLGPLLVG